MEQLYLIETFVNEIEFDDLPENKISSTITVHAQFEGVFEFTIKQGEFVTEPVSSGDKAEQSEETVKENSEENVEGDSDDDSEEGDDNERVKNPIIIPMRIGKSFLFPSYADTLLQAFQKHPFNFTLWVTEDNDRKDFIGVAKLVWDSEFVDMVKASSDWCKKPLRPLTHKAILAVTDECCCKTLGKLTLFLRLSHLGKGVMTVFQQVPDDSDSFIIQTDKARSSLQCKVFKSQDDPEICNSCTMIGSIYESLLLKDPEVIKAEHRKNMECSKYEQAGINRDDIMFVCGDETEKKETPKKRLETIRLGDIKGPCGNPQCSLAEKVRAYLRNAEANKNKEEDCEPENKSQCDFECDVTCNYCTNLATDMVNDVVNRNNDFPGCTLVNSPGGSTSATNSENYICEFDDARSGSDSCVCEKPPEPKDETCGGFDCVCREEVVKKEIRKHHKPYCPVYAHKKRCPVTLMRSEPVKSVIDEDDSRSISELEEQKAMSILGMTGFKLAQCPVPGKPCTTPNGFEKLKPPPKPKKPTCNLTGQSCCSKI